MISHLSLQPATRCCPGAVCQAGLEAKAGGWKVKLSFVGGAPFTEFRILLFSLRSKNLPPTDSPPTALSQLGNGKYTERTAQPPTFFQTFAFSFKKLGSKVLPVVLTLKRNVNWAMGYALVQVAYSFTNCE